MDERWCVVDVAPVVKLKEPVTLAQVKAEPKLAEMQLITRGRLSVVHALLPTRLISVVSLIMSATSSTKGSTQSLFPRRMVIPLGWVRVSAFCVRPFLRSP